MDECSAMKESMPFLLTESLDPVRRELTHQHIEGCALCAEEWQATKETWAMLGDLPELEPPARVRERFLAAVLPQPLIATPPPSNVVPFHRRSATKWVAQAAAVALLVGGSYFAGHRTAPVQIQQQPAQLSSVQPVSYSLAETRTIPARAMSPNIEGRPDIQNVQFIDADPSDNQIAVAFDVNQRVTVTGSPNDKSLVRLLSYVLEQENATTSRSNAIEVVRQTYSKPAYADPEIAAALAKVLRNDDHEGVRINAVETLQNLPPSLASPASETRQALIEALKSDPNPAVRIKAVEALLNLAKAGETLDAATVDTLRQKASQDDENLYVRVKAAEALSNIRP